MAVHIATDNGLVTLRVRVQPRDRAIGAELQLVSYADGAPRTVGDWWLGSTELALPMRLTAQWRPTRALPPAVVDALRAALHAIGVPTQVPLWLHLVKPYGFLGALDWEGALVGPLGRPVLRLPDFLERPRENRSALDVALVCSEPVSEPRLDPPQVLSAVVGAILAGSRRARTAVHVFADQRVHATLRATFSAETRVAVHDPRDAPRRDAPDASRRADAGGGLQSPWLRWMRDSMRGRSLDAVHFVGHGGIAEQCGTLALAESPRSNRDPHDARHVGVAELAAFLTQVGAWSAVFSSPPANFSEAGLRLLADALAQTRPGPVLYHELDAAGAADPTVRAMYGFLYAPEASPLPPQRRWFAYCQPALVAGLAPPPRSAPQPAAAALDANSRLFGESVAPVEPVAADASPARRRGAAPRVMRGSGPTAWSASTERASTEQASTERASTERASIERASIEPTVVDLGAATDAVAPVWLSAAQRYVEQQSMQLQRSGVAEAHDDGIAAEVERTLARLQAIVGGAAQAQRDEAPDAGGFDALRRAVGDVGDAGAAGDVGDFGDFGGGAFGR